MSLGMVSCVDNSYDLDEVDMTVGSDIDLQLPSSSTGMIQLRNIMDLQEDGVVKLVKNPNGEDSIYVVSEKGTADIEPLTIEQISFNSPSISAFDATIPLRQYISGVKRKLKGSTTVLGTDIEYDIEDYAFNYDIKGGQASQRLNGEADVKSHDVVRIERVVLKDDLTADLDLEITGMPLYLNQVHLDNMVFSFPKTLSVNSCLLDGKPCKVNHENGTIELTKAVENVSDNTFAVTNGTLKVTLNLTLDKGIDFSEFANADEYNAALKDPKQEVKNFIFYTDSRRANIDANFDITGTFRVQTSDMDPDVLVSRVAAFVESKKSDVEWIANLVSTKKILLKDVAELVPENLYFTGKAVVNKEKPIVIQKVSGEFKHSIGKIDPIKLNDLPDFMNDPEVVLDLDNPMVFLKTSTDIPAKVNTELTLTSVSKNGSVVRKTGEINLEGNQTYWMCNDFSKVMYMPDEYDLKTLLQTPLYDADGKAADVTGLIKKVPEQVQVGIRTVTMKVNDLDITQTYHVSVDYDVYAPLSFGPQFYLVYQDTESELDLGDDMDDVQFSKDMALTIDMDVESTLPADFTLSVTPKDAYGETLTTLEPISINVKDASQGSQKVRIQLKPTPGHTLNEVLHSGQNQLDGIHYKAVMKGTPGQTLVDTGSITLKNIKVSVKGAVSYDAN